MWRKFSRDMAKNVRNGTLRPEMDQKKGVHWYAAAAEEGHVIAQFNLGVMLSKGQSCVTDREAAVGWFRKAADQGMTAVQTAFADALMTGAGVAKDTKEARLGTRLQQFKVMNRRSNILRR